MHTFIEKLFHKPPATPDRLQHQTARFSNANPMCTARSQDLKNEEFKVLPLSCYLRPNATVAYRKHQTHIASLPTDFSHCLNVKV